MAYISRAYIRLLAEQLNEDKRIEFECMGDGGHYCEKQKNYVFELIDQYGIRATARILKIPRGTLQRWCKKHFMYVRRCPDWVYGWAERRRKRREF